MSAQGRSLELFFVDGRPDGMLTAEVFNWTGHVLRTPRTQIREALERPEAGYTGVYLLLGEGDERSRLYIGEAEDLRERLRDHVKTRDWWNEAILITTAGDALHKAHVKYLESRLVEIARDVGQAELDNGNTPARSSLSEAATANMESFIDTLQMVLPAIRIDAFLSRKRNPKPDPAAVPAPQVFEFVIPKHGVAATAVLQNGEMIVQAGSHVRPHWAADRKWHSYYWKLHDELVASGTIRTEGNVGILTSDLAFSSPSAAAALVSGRSANGRVSWIHRATGQTYGNWEEAQITGDAP